MKKTKLLFGALAMLAFTGCSDDKNAGAPDQTLNDGTESYITIRIQDAHSLIGGRAGETFENGANDVSDGTSIYEESKIKSLVIAFFDANKNFITYSSSATPLDFGPTETTGANIETNQEVKVTLTLTPEQALPAYAIAFANPIEDKPALSNVTSTQNRQRLAWGTSNDNVYSFAMNNTVYFNNSGEMQLAVPVSSNNFYKGDDDSEADAVDFYIERVAGKVVLTGNGSNGALTEKSDSKTVNDGTQTGSTKYVVFVPEKWGLNAEEKSTYLMKYFTQPYTTLNTNLNWGENRLWNDITNKRCYWAHSVTWGESSFPDVSDDVTSDDAYKLKYHSFKYISTNGVAFGKPQYTLENTKQQSAYSKNSALVSAVVIGHYELRDEAGTAVTPASGEVLFYRRNGELFTPDGFMSKMAATQNMIGTVTTTDSKETFTALTAEQLKQLVTVYHPNTNSLGGKVKENLVSIKLKDGADLSSYKIRLGEGDYKELSASGKSVADINSYLLSVCGLTEAYTEGKAYFNIPVEHLGRELEGGTKSAGFYGVVRNHTYEISISGWAPTAFGNGVFDEDKPIVPDTSTDEYNFKANFKVHAWRVVSKTVTLK